MLLNFYFIALAFALCEYDIPSYQPVLNGEGQTTGEFTGFMWVTPPYVDPQYGWMTGEGRIRIPLPERVRKWTIQIRFPTPIDGIKIMMEWNAHATPIDSAGYVWHVTPRVWNPLISIEFFPRWKDLTMDDFIP